MILRKITKQNQFTIVDNKIFRDPNLTLEMVGLLCKILSLPNNWQFNMKGLSSILNVTYTTLKRILKLLATYGYFKRTRISAGKKGFFYEYLFFEESRWNEHIKYYRDDGKAFKFTEKELSQILPAELLNQSNEL